MQKGFPIKLAYLSKVSKMPSLSGDEVLEYRTLPPSHPSKPFHYQAFHYVLLRRIIKND